MRQKLQPVVAIILIPFFWHSEITFAQNCSNISVGLKPLTELGTGLYKGYPGGLYPNGQNQRPSSHDSLGRALAQQIKPLRSAGTVDQPGGKIVLLSIGMSNATQEFSTFVPMANADVAKNPQLAIVDGAQGGQTASIISDPNANFWTVIDQRLAAAGVTRQQVQVAWVKEANANPTQAFPVHAQTLQSNYESIARILISKYPNMKIAYYSSRTYAGYATSTLNPEPYAYESGFAVKWLIEKQINGDPSLAPTGPTPQAPWLAWGPYLWGDGMTARNDGLVWECTDFQSDGTHPSPSGRQKVANLLLSFFKTDPTATAWFLQPSATTAGERRRSVPSEFILDQNYPNPFNPTTTIQYTLPEETMVTLEVLDVLGRKVVTLVSRQQVAGVYAVRFDLRTSGVETLPGGVYFYRLQARQTNGGQAGNLTAIKKLLVLK